MLTLVLAALLAFFLGFAAHRGSVCAVRAVAEAMHARTGYMAASLLKSALWVLVLVVPALWLAAAPAVGGWQLTGEALLGGALFGAGAGLNGACAYATMARLVDGEGRMLAAILGFALGVAAFVTLLDGGLLVRPAPTPAHVEVLARGGELLAGALLALGAAEAIRLWLSRPRGRSLKAMLLAPQYRLSTTAMVIGVMGAALLLLVGPSGYSSTFEVVVEGAFGTRPWPVPARWLVLVAVLAGMLASTLQRGSFRLDLKPNAAWARSFAGGVLMGLGVALTPGGNDALVLYGLPTLSPHALPAFAAMVAGIAGALWLSRRIFDAPMRVVCRNDLFVTDHDPAPAAVPASAPAVARRG